MRRARVLSAIIALLLLERTAGHAATSVQNLPDPPRRDVTFVLPHWFGFLSESDERVSEEVAKLRDRIGEGRYVRVGFSFYLPVTMTDWSVDPSDRAAVRAALTDTITALDTAIARARANGIPIGIGVFTALRSGTDASQAASELEDRRNMQWYSDNGLASGWWSHSRYARKQTLVQEAYIREIGRILANRVALYPETIVALAGDGEVELSFDRAPGIGAPGTGDPVLADYSPFAVAEFRDWLRHGGMYAAGEPFAGEGYNLGTRYAGDASPAEDSNADGHTLNGDFGTTFTSWSLRYFDWSLDDPAASDPNAIPVATYGQPGWDPLQETAAGGFDAPRYRTPSDSWLLAWRAFREQMIWRHNLRYAKWVTTSIDDDTGKTVPSALWYSYQIPGDYLFGATPQQPATRLETSASPWWSADIAPFGSLGITSFNIAFPGGFVGRTLAGVVPQIAGRHARWGLLEWNPCLRADSVPDDINVCRLDNDLIVQHRPSVILPFAWDLPEFPIEDTSLETALHELVDRIKDGYAPSPMLWIDLPVDGATVTGALTMSGWALDLGNAGAGRSTGINALHVYAFPEAAGQAPIFLGEAQYGIDRPDLGAYFGSEFSPSGFSLTAAALPTGRYRLVVFARATVTETFLITKSVNVTVVGPVPAPAIALGAPLSFSTSGSTVTVNGWAIDRGAPAGTGVNLIHVYAFPSGGGSPTFMGEATYGLSRPDVGGIFGAQFTSSGFQLQAPVAPGNYTIVAYMRSTVSGTFNATAVSTNVTVNSTNSNPMMLMDGPPHGSVRTLPFVISGWAVDTGAASGTGIDAIHIWAFPVSGGPQFFVGVGTYGTSRPDVGSYLGDSRYDNSGFTFTATSGNVPPGTYDFQIFGRSTVTGGFTVARVVRVTVE